VVNLLFSVLLFSVARASLDPHPVKSMLPIGVVVPTRNSAPLVAQHLETIRPWLDQVEEVVVVDSFSKDGTVELLKTGLQHPFVRFLEHPPGLYQSWNFGISQLKTEYCYISTVGDGITREGLQQLADVISRLRGDVVISKPRFVDVNGSASPPPRWPIDDLLTTLNVTEPKVLEGMGLLLFTLLNYRDAILGSSASNLYRTRVLQENPFPVDYGTAGDCGWGLANCLKIRLAITPQVFSTLREHPKAYSRAEYEVDQMSKKMLDRICQTYREAMAQDSDFARVARDLQIERMIDILYDQLACQLRLEEYRQGSVWVFYPGAWKARNARERKKRELDKLKSAAISKLFRK
jgi:glycosyltransferase involved in cell wall biosynthesis